MFSFHRPKVYRSPTGCCICKAKSSRFTDSKKYEQDFLECFQLATPRQGEICNACVLLVKRWKKLPAGSDRNWRHVVDARAGPGMKSMTKVKSKNKRLLENEKMKKKKHFEREYSPTLSDKSDGQDADMGDDFYSESGPITLCSVEPVSPIGSDCDETIQSRNSNTSNCSNNNSVNTSTSSRRHKSQVNRRHENSNEISGFIDLDFWKSENICCGTVFRGPNGEILIDPNLFKPCNARLATCKFSMKTEKVLGVTAESSAIGKSYSDSSSDSGYDESSNQGSADPTSFKKEIQPVSISQLNREVPACNGN